MRETFIIHSRLSLRQVRGAAAVERQHGLQAIAIEHLVARLAGGFLQPINSDSLKEAIGEAVALDLGELNEIKTLPGLSKSGGVQHLRKLGPLALNSMNSLTRRMLSFARALTQSPDSKRSVLERLPASMRRPADLVALALQRLQYAKALFGAIRVIGRTEMSPVWRPLLAALKDVTDVQWVAGPRQVPAWVRSIRNCCH